MAGPTPLLLDLAEANGLDRESTRQRLQAGEGAAEVRSILREAGQSAILVTHNQAEALALANDTLYGLGAGVWSRDASRLYRMGRGIQAGRVWTNCYHAYPAHAAFGGYKQSGIGRENHLDMLNHYQQTKNLLVSYSPKALGFF